MSLDCDFDWKTKVSSRKGKAPMLYFTADLHFSHENIIKHTHRPFQNSDEMNHALIKKWNEKISPGDEVYILGDFTMKGAKLATALLSCLKGKKHLIRGNHDGFVSSADFDRSLFASIEDYAEITYSNTLFILSHYPFVEWNNSHKGSISLHGHQHNPPEYNYENLRLGIRRYDVGVDANSMAPVSAEDILAFFQL